MSFTKEQREAVETSGSVPMLRRHTRRSSRLGMLPTVSKTDKITNHDEHETRSRERGLGG